MTRSEIEQINADLVEFLTASRQQIDDMLAALAPADDEEDVGDDD